MKMCVRHTIRRAFTPPQENECLNYKIQTFLTYWPWTIATFKPPDFGSGGRVCKTHANGWVRESQISASFDDVPPWQKFTYPFSQLKKINLYFPSD